MDFTGFEKTAKHLAHPLVLIGFALALFFGLLDNILQSRLLSQVSAGESSVIIKLILQYGFWLGLLLIPLGFGLAFWKSWVEKKLFEN
jgi:hypothetical protein